MGEDTAKRLDRVVQIVSKLNQKVYGQIEAWRNRKIEGRYPYVYLDGVILKRTWSGEVRNLSMLVAIGVDEDGFRSILGVAEGAKEDYEGWCQREPKIPSYGNRKFPTRVTLRPLRYARGRPSTSL